MRTKHIPKSGIRSTTESTQPSFRGSVGDKEYPPILTPQQAAEMLQIPLSTIYDWSSRGRLASCARRAGKHLRISRDGLLQLLSDGGLTSQS